MCDSIPISALQHYSFCPRQCGYIHLEQRWHENYLTAKGKQLHARVHKNESESRRNLITERSVGVQSIELGIHGQLDLLEIQKVPYSLTPVEYKKGQSKGTDCDRIQLCAQALCLEEMRGINIEWAALWYWKSRNREWVELSESLREATLSIIVQTREMLESCILPASKWTKACKACSFFEECNPKSPDKSAQYIEDLFQV